MNLTQHSSVDVGQSDVGVWTLPSEIDSFPLRPNRRRRRLLAATRSDFVWSVLTVSLLVWMTFVALTLWH